MRYTSINLLSGTGIAIGSPLFTLKEPILYLTGFILIVGCLIFLLIVGDRADFPEENNVNNEKGGD